jgi:hypothetical protein
MDRKDSIHIKLRKRQDSPVGLGAEILDLEISYMILFSL